LYCQRKKAASPELTKYLSKYYVGEEMPASIVESSGGEIISGAQDEYRKSCDGQFKIV
jgi:hypothetical protein